MLLGSDLENTCTSACEETHYCQSFTVCRVWDYCYYKLFDARDTHTVSLSLSYNKEVAQIRHETTPGIDHEANGGGGGSEESTEESGAPEGPEATTDGPGEANQGPETSHLH